MRSQDSAGFDLILLLEALHDVDFIVVGDVATNLHGGPRLTADLDIVPERSDSNVHALGECLHKIAAVVREPGNRKIPATVELLAATLRSAKPGQLRTTTQHGPVDILWALHDGRGYEELRAGAVVLEDDERQILVIGIDDLIAAKTATGRPQDDADLRYLTRIKEGS